tara:strand:+ start:270 stop:566 length:297 start_codon:yes stop_codon:yes gene_type:complete
MSEGTPLYSIFSNIKDTRSDTQKLEDIKEVFLNRLKSLTEENNRLTETCLTQGDEIKRLNLINETATEVLKTVADEDHGDGGYCCGLIDEALTKIEGK